VEQNPYAAPRSRVEDSAEPFDATEVATRGRRFLNLLIDFFGYMALSVLIGVVLGVLYPRSIGLLEGSGTLGNYGFGILVMTLYYLPQEALFGRTLGKLVTGTRVVTEDGETASFGKLLGRTAARFIPFEPFSFFGTGGIGWHDRLSGTRVVRVSRR